MSSPTKPTHTPSDRSDSVELRLIPEFDGSDSQSITEWLDKVELICSLRGVTKLETVIPLRLSGGAFKVYQQIPSADRSDVTKIKNALIAAFGDDSFSAYDSFISRKLRSDESVDVYLADLRTLATAFGGVPDKALSCAFVAGLPESVRQTLRASSRMETMDVGEILQRARAVMVDEPVVVGAVRSRCGPTTLHQRAPVSSESSGCFECGFPNHRARDCLRRLSRGTRRGTSGGTGGGSMPSGSVKCFRCGGRGHVARNCTGNGEGEKTHAPAFSPSNL